MEINFNLLKRRGKIILFCVSFFLGVAVLSRLIADSMFFYLALLICLIIGYLFWKTFETINNRILLVFVAGFLLGVLRMFFDLLLVGNLSNFNDLGRVVELKAEISADPIVVDNFQQVILKVSELLDGANSYTVDGLVKLKLEKYPLYQLGDQLLISGRLETPQKFNADFDYPEYLSKDKVFSIIKKPLIESRVENDQWYLTPIKFINVWRRNIINEINQIFSEPTAGLVAGVLVGARSSIPSDILSDFQAVGLTHILAISGFNITLIINLMAILLANLPRGRRVWLNVMLIIIFVFLTGCSASVVRAAIMGLMILLIKTIGKKSETLTVIFLTAFLMVLVSPRILNFDISFELSLMATLSLILYSERLEKLAQNWPANIKEGILVTLSAQILTLPISFYYFGSISIISPFSNLLILPFVPILMATSFFSLFCSIIYFPLAKWTGIISWLLVEVMIRMVEFLAKIPGSALYFPKAMVGLVLLYYLMVFRLFHKS